MAELTDYERERQQRIEANQARMRELGVAEAAANIASGSQQNNKPRPARAPRQYQTVEIRPEDLRKSHRVKKEVDYNETTAWKQQEQALAQAERRSRAPATRKVRVSVDCNGEAREVGDKAGWNPSMGQAGALARQRCLEAARQRLEELEDEGKDAFVKILLYSMVASGFWCSAPQALRSHLKVDQKVNCVIYKGPGYEMPEGSRFEVEDPANGAKYWSVVWLPRKGGDHGFSGGWRSCALDLKLFPSDLAVMEVVPPSEHRIDGHRFSIILHIFRALDYESECERLERLADMEAAAERAAAEEKARIAKLQADAEKAAAKETKKQGKQMRTKGLAKKKAAAEEEEADEAAEDSAGDSEVEAALSDEDEQQADVEREEEMFAADEGEQQQVEEEDEQLAEVQGQLDDPADVDAAAAELLNSGAEQDAATGVAAAYQAAVALSQEVGLQAEEPAASPAALASSGKRQRQPKLAAAGGSKPLEKPAAAAMPTASPVKVPKAARKRAAVAVEQSALPDQVPKAARKRAASVQPEEEAYEVERIMAVQGKGKRMKIEIKWVGYDETSWEPVTMLDNPIKTYALAPGVALGE